jgi:hypothetical protein
LSDDGIQPLGDLRLQQQQKKKHGKKNKKTEKH